MTTTTLTETQNKELEAIKAQREALENQRQELIKKQAEIEHIAKEKAKRLERYSQLETSVLEYIENMKKNGWVYSRFVDEFGKEYEITQPTVDEIFNNMMPYDIFHSTTLDETDREILTKFKNNISDAQKHGNIRFSIWHKPSNHIIIVNVSPHSKFEIVVRFPHKKRYNGTTCRFKTSAIAIKEIKKRLSEHVRQYNNTQIIKDARKKILDNIIVAAKIRFPEYDKFSADYAMRRSPYAPQRCQWSETSNVNLQIRKGDDYSTSKSFEKVKLENGKLTCEKLVVQRVEL